uniref:Putative glutathione s-transferase c-terminal domain-containing-containing protein n=1 Tax=Xenopsylla cheopis TaxID=163159 RepID=A0A6M2DE72_XENCH
MAALYIQVFVRVIEHGEFTYHVSLESVISLFTYRYCKSNITLYFVKCDYNALDLSFEIKLLNLKFNWLNMDSLPQITKSCTLPVITISSNFVISGLCSVSRQIIMLSQQFNYQENTIKLLGFRNACLISPNETSMWTKFCEIDIEHALKLIITKHHTEETFLIPVDIARFENHLGQPVRIHNVYKLAHNLIKKKKKLSESSSTKDSLKCASDMPNDSLIRTSEYFPVKYIYAEGMDLTLSDIILFPCFYICFKYLNQNEFSEKIPLITKWYKQISTERCEVFLNTIDFLDIKQNFFEYKNIITPHVEGYSLYKSNPKHYKCRTKNYTRQNDIDNVLQLLTKISLEFKNSLDQLILTKAVNWNSLPFDALPEGGNLPEKRQIRKRQQLENLTRVVIQLANPGDHIVDFCSGSGHLGIIIAFLLPQCQIYLLENKEESINRAKLRVSKLGLKNVSFLQCNLDFFRGSFEIGVSLHACGVATDLVMRHCIKRKAKFVCCPCCYGKVQICHHLSYPRSQIFQKLLQLQEYLVLGHGADQTHDINNIKTAQGEICMNFIDTDRLLYAKEHGYDVVLQKLDPPTCTPKNNLLVGVFSKL